MIPRVPVPYSAILGGRYRISPRSKNETAHQHKQKKAVSALVRRPRKGSEQTSVLVRGRKAVSSQRRENTDVAHFVHRQEGDSGGSGDLTSDAQADEIDVPAEVDEAFLVHLALHSVEKLLEGCVRGVGRTSVGALEGTTARAATAAEPSSMPSKEARAYRLIHEVRSRAATDFRTFHRVMVYLRTKGASRHCLEIFQRTAADSFIMFLDSILGQSHESESEENLLKFVLYAEGEFCLLFGPDNGLRAFVQRNKYLKTHTDELFRCVDAGKMHSLRDRTLLEMTKDELHQIYGFDLASELIDARNAFVVSKLETWLDGCLRYPGCRNSSKRMPQHRSTIAFGPLCKLESVCGSEEGRRVFRMRNKILLDRLVKLKKARSQGVCGRVLVELSVSVPPDPNSSFLRKFLHSTFGSSRISKLLLRPFRKVCLLRSKRSRGSSKKVSCCGGVYRRRGVKTRHRRGGGGSWRSSSRRTRTRRRITRIPRGRKSRKTVVRVRRTTRIPRERKSRKTVVRVRQSKGLKKVPVMRLSCDSLVLSSDSDVDVDLSSEEEQEQEQEHEGDHDLLRVEVDTDRISQPSARGDLDNDDDDLLGMMVSVQSPTETPLSEMLEDVEVITTDWTRLEIPKVSDQGVEAEFYCSIFDYVSVLKAWNREYPSDGPRVVFGGEEKCESEDDVILEERKEDRDDLVILKQWDKEHPSEESRVVFGGEEKDQLDADVQSQDLDYVGILKQWDKDFPSDEPRVVFGGLEHLESSSSDAKEQDEVVVHLESSPSDAEEKDEAVVHLESSSSKVEEKDEVVVHLESSPSDAEEKDEVVVHLESSSSEVEEKNEVVVGPEHLQSSPSEVEEKDEAVVHQESSPSEGEEKDVGLDHLEGSSSDAEEKDEAVVDPEHLESSSSEVEEKDEAVVGLEHLEGSSSEVEEKDEAVVGLEHLESSSSEVQEKDEMVVGPDHLESSPSEVEGRDAAHQESSASHVEEKKDVPNLDANRRVRDIGVQG